MEVDKKNNSDWADWIWRLFISLKFTVLLLALWLIFSVAGTLVPQNAEPGRYVELYGPSAANLMMRLGLFDVFHSTWYAVILLLLLLSIVACTINLLPAKRVFAFNDPKTRRIGGPPKRRINITVGNASPADFARLTAAIKHRFKNIDEFSAEDGAAAVFAHRQSWAHFSIVIVHVSIVLIIIGGVLSSLFGFDGVMEIENGAEQNIVFKKQGAQYQPVSIGFALRCDEFELQRFKNGMPKDYVSKLTVVDNEREILTKRIEVNDPLFFGGYNFYQSSYSEMAPLLLRAANGKSVKVNLQKFESRMVPELNARVRLDSFAAMPDRMAAQLSVSSMDRMPYRISLNSVNAKSGGNPGDPVTVEFYQNQPAYQTGLQVVSDPGVGLVWAGSALIMIGLYLTFYFSHRRILAVFRNGAIEISAASQRNAASYRNEVDKIISEAGLSAASGKQEQ